MSAQPWSDAFFYYGLFMDLDLLRESSASPDEPAAGATRHYRLRIGQRATLLPEIRRAPTECW